MNYPKNINDCANPPSKGGLPIKDLRDLATKMGIDVKGLKKVDICNEIEALLEGAASDHIAQSRKNFPELKCISDKIQWYPTKKMGVGAEGAVYEACDKNNICDRVLKVYFDKVYLGERDLSTEVKLQNKSAQLGFAPEVFKSGRCDGKSFILMEKIVGSEVSEVYPISKELFKQIFNMYITLLDNGIAHSDLKTCNVIIEEGTMTPYLIDFGIAKEMPYDKEHLKAILLLFARSYFNESVARDYACTPSKWTQDTDEDRKTQVMIDLLNIQNKILKDHSFEDQEIFDFFTKLYFELPNTDAARKWKKEHKLGAF